MVLDGLAWHWDSYYCILLWELKISDQTKLLPWKSWKWMDMAFVIFLWQSSKAFFHPGTPLRSFEVASCPWRTVALHVVSISEIQLIQLIQLPYLESKVVVLAELNGTEPIWATGFCFSKIGKMTLPESECGHTVSLMQCTQSTWDPNFSIFDAEDRNWFTTCFTHFTHFTHESLQSWPNCPEMCSKHLPGALVSASVDPF